MSDFYTPQQRVLQDQFRSRALADRVASLTVHDFISDEEQAFIESRDMFFLSTIDERGMPTVSYKGGDPGFVAVPDRKTLEFPIFDGNGMFLSTGNVATNGKVGLLFMDFEQPHRIRVHGSAGVVTGEDELSVRVTVEEVFVNCPRYIHRYQKIGASKHVPRNGEPKALADWKRIDAFQDVLDDGERQQVQSAGVLTIQEYEELRKLKESS